jgi:hypothetical protein
VLIFSNWQLVAPPLQAANGTTGTSLSITGTVGAFLPVTVTVCASATSYKWNNCHFPLKNGIVVVFLPATGTASTSHLVTGIAGGFLSSNWNIWRLPHSN